MVRVARRGLQRLLAGWFCSRRGLASLAGRARAHASAAVDVHTAPLRNITRGLQVVVVAVFVGHPRR
eukprot:3414947-Prymnesium_polylepis.1